MDPPFAAKSVPNLHLVDLPICCVVLEKHRCSDDGCGGGGGDGDG